MTPAEESPAEPSRQQRLDIAREAVPGALTRPESLIPFLVKRLGEATISRAAAALSFSTALAVVPGLALVLATLAAFPAFDGLRASLQAAIVTNLVPDTGMKISDALNNFVEAAGKLTLFGVIGLVITSVLLLLTIEGALNQIFKVIRPRLLRQRLLVFWAVMTIGPVLLGMGVSLMSYFLSQEMIEGQAAPVSTPMALLLAMLRYVFALYIIFMSSYQAIYGALAAVPVFLVWVFLVWLAVLAGAVVTAALPDWRYARAEVGVGTAGRMLLALEILARLAVARRGGVGLALEHLAKTLGAPDTILTAILNDLRAGNFIAPTEDGRWVLSRDLERTPLADLVHHFGLGLNLDMGRDDLKTSELGKRLGQNLRNAAESERTLLSITLARVVASPEDAPSLPQ